jgi:hypothetical protein
VPVDVIYRPEHERNNMVENQCGDWRRRGGTTNAAKRKAAASHWDVQKESFEETRLLKRDLGISIQ